MRIIFSSIIFLVWLVPSLAFAQQYDYTNTNQITETLFVQKDWATLLKESRQAIQQGTDFYDLRLRRGLAYLTLKKYRLALAEFEASQKFFPADTVGKYYLCIAHDALGNSTQAQQKANTLPEGHRKDLAYQKQSLLEAGLFGSYTSFDAQSKLPNIAQKEIGEWNAYRGLTGGGLYISHLAGKRLAFTHTGSFFFQNFKKVNYPSQRVIFYNDGIQAGGGTIAQLFLSRGWKINANLQYNHIATYTETLNTQNIYVAGTFSKGGFLAGGSVEKRYKNFDFLLGSYWNNFLQYYTLQETAGLTYYPFSNASLFFRTQLSFVQNLTETNTSYQNTRLLLLKANVQVCKSVWLSGSYLKGDTQNFYDIENNAIYYTTDRTTQQFQGSVYSILGKHLRLSVGYTHITRESDQYVALNATASSIKPITYTAHQFTTALVWKF